MKKLFTLITSVLFCFVVFAQTPTAVVKKVVTVPVIDGTAEAAWALAPKNNIDKKFTQAGVPDNPTLGTSGQTTWQALWNLDGIFILLTVADDVFFPHYAVTPAGNNWEFDKPEIYFDVNYVLKDGLGSKDNKGHYQVAPGFTQDKNDGTLFTATNGVKHAFLVTGQTYKAEYFIPWTLLLDKDGNAADKMGVIGFDVTIIDRDNAAGTRQRAVWSNIGTINESYSNMDDCGKITLEGADALTLMDKITLTGPATITTDNGTAQLTAAILPANTSNKNLKWTVDNISAATVSSTGLVTAIRNGVIKVKAAATDGSWVESNTFTITITNQILQESEVNLIKNGSFDKDGGLPEFWGFWSGNGGTSPVVVNGVVNCKPGPASADVWNYQFNQSGLTALPNIPYVFSFKAWAAAARNINVDFEDTPSNNYNRYGTSTDPESNGTSDWTFGVTATPKTFTFNVVFDKMVPTTVQKVQFMLATTADMVYIDDVKLISKADLALTSSNSLNANTIRLYPNPVGKESLLTVEVSEPNTMVSVYSILGAKLMERQVSTRTQFDVSDLSKGVYFVRLNNGSSHKFIKAE